MGWGNAVRLEVGGARRFPGRSVSCRFSILGAEKQGPFSLSAGSPATPVYQGAEAHCPLNGKLPVVLIHGHLLSPCGACAWAAMGREASSEALTSHALCPRTRTDVSLQDRW